LPLGKHRDGMGEISSITGIGVGSNSMLIDRSHRDRGPGWDWFRNHHGGSETYRKCGGDHNPDQSLGTPQGDQHLHAEVVNESAIGECLRNKSAVVVDGVQGSRTCLGVMAIADHYQRAHVSKYLIPQQFFIARFKCTSPFSQSPTRQIPKVVSADVVKQRTKLVISSLNPNPVHLSQPEGKLRRAGAKQEERSRESPYTRDRSPSLLGDWRRVLIYRA
jgi:hypothetical protein